MKIKTKSAICTVLALIATLTIATTALAARVTQTPNGYTVVHDSWKSYSPNNAFMTGWSSTNVYKTTTPSETKLHYTHVWIKKDSGSIISDSGRVYGYNTVSAYTDEVENAASYYLGSGWGGVY